MTTVVTGGNVVPGTVEAGLVKAGTTVDPSDRLGEIVVGGTVEGETTLPGRVVVYVSAPPNSLAGIALPTPLLVNGIGNTIAAVFGMADSSPLYRLPVWPFESLKLPVMRFA